MDVWHRLTAPTFAALSTRNFKVLEEKDITERSLGFSFVRLLPKENGLRPISNLRRKLQRKTTGSARVNMIMGMKKYGGLSINTVLQNAFQVLTYEKVNSDVTRDPSLLGASVLGLNDIYARLKGLKSQLEGARGSRKLYFCKVDITSSFDTINQELLLQVVRDVVQDDEYIIQKYSMLYPSAGQLKRSFARRARPAGEYTQFAELAKELAEAFRNTVFVDHVTYTFEERDAIMELLTNHICNNLVKMGKKYYRQIVGIPQGSVLSTLLCSFFYAHLEHTELTSFTSSPDAALLRLVDDFLYVTTDLEKAKGFLERMGDGFPAHGCVVNMEKTLVNFEVEGGGRGVKKVEGMDLRETLSVEISRHPFSSLRHKMMQYLKPKCHAIFFDTTFNSRATVLLNIYQNFLLCAAKFYLHVKELAGWGGMGVVGESGGELVDIVLSTIKFCRVLIKSRMKSVSARKVGCRVGVEGLEISWLGLHAFITILKAKRTVYKDVIEVLEKELGAGQYRGICRRLQAVVDGNLSRVFEEILF
ncbi:hypothetical protein HDV00_000766 [Rhizophlyctis rosea]|nr:hypothetical protein HDV00_000766 [Rhizophlyctis rosea]